jgi:predicted amidophosphoribosyltransferase
MNNRPYISTAAVETFEKLVQGVGHDLIDCTTGICLSCGAESDNIEPDAIGYTCEQCGKPTVYGAEELSIMMHS